MIRSRAVGEQSLSSLAALLILGLCGPAVRADLRFARTEANLGEVYSGKPLAHDFLFDNPGPEAIEVIDVRAGCGCLTPRLDTRTYRPGERGSLRVEVNTLTQPPGPNTWRVQVTYRCGDAVREVSLALSAEVLVEVSVQPAALNVIADRGVSHEVVVADRRDKPLNVTEVRTSSPHLHARVAEQYRDVLQRWIRKVRLDVADDFPEGRHEEAMTIYTDDPGYGELRVPVTVTKRPRQRVTATPNEAIIQAAPGQPIPSRIVLVRDREEQEVVIEAVRADDPAVTCTWAKGPNTMATLKITVDRDRMHGDELRCAVHVEVSNPVRQTLTVPVSCIRR
jgi:hypothetical protein